MPLSWVKRSLSLILLTLLVGCQLAPPYQRPSVDLPEQFETAAVNQQRDSIATLTWQVFFQEDPILVALIQQALTYNKDWQIAQLNARIAQAQYGVATANAFPSFSAQASAVLSPEVVGQGIKTQYSVGLGLNAFEIDIAGKQRYQRDAQWQAWRVSLAQVQQARIQLIATVANSYYSVRILKALESSAQATVQQYTQRWRQIQERQRAGLASQLDVNQAQQSIFNAQRQQLRAAQNLALATQALHTLTGQTLPSLPTTPPEVHMQSIPAGLPSDLLMRRPDIIAAEAQLQAAHAHIGAARAAFFPSIHLTGLLGMASPDLLQLFSPDRFLWNFSPKIHLPIFTAGALRRQLDIAQLRQQQQVIVYEKTVIQAFREVKDTLHTLHFLREQQKILQQYVQSAAVSLRLATQRYEAGLDSFLPVYTAQIQQLQQEQEFLNITLSQLQTRVKLYEVLGGGWEPPDEQSSIGR